MFFHCIGQKTGQDFCPALPEMLLLFAEVPFQQTLEGLAVAGFVTGHFMHGVIVGLRPTAGNENNG